MMSSDIIRLPARPSNLGGPFINSENKCVQDVVSLTSGQPSAKLDFAPISENINRTLAQKKSLVPPNCGGLVDFRGDENPRNSLLERAREFLQIPEGDPLESIPGEAADEEFYDNKTYVPNTRQFSLLKFHKLKTGRPTLGFSCDYPYCGKLFLKWHNLFDHLRIHTGERPFLCPVKGCGIRFNQVAN